MKNRGLKLYLLDILEAIRSIELYVEGASREDFTGDKKTVDAVIRNFEVIGEAAKKIPEEIRLKYPNTPWKKMTEMRNRLIHEYFGIDPEIVWETIQDDLPTVKPLIEKVLSELRE